MRNSLFFAAVLQVAAQAALGQTAQVIDPMLGVDGGGNTFPGPSVPFGMIKPGPDVGDNTGNAGWKADGEINGFSQTHVSGTGGGDKYGNVLVQPTVGRVRSSDYGSPRSGERAETGLYQVTLSRYPVDVAITSARRTALYAFTYPEQGQRNLLFDVSHVLSAYAENGEGQTVTDSTIRVISPSEVEGSTTVTGGWNQQTTTYTVYFHAQTDVMAASWGTWLENNLAPGVREQHGHREEADGAWMTFPTNPAGVVHLKVGISFVSTAQARRNAIEEIPTFNFNAVRAQALASWERALSPLQIDGATLQERQVFYTALYHTMLMPVDRTGENPLWRSGEPSYDDYYTIWDTFRSSSPLLTLIAPGRQSGIVRSLIDIYRHEGWLPDGRTGNFNGRTQGGSDAEFVIVDAFLKGVSGIDWQTAYAAMIKDAEVLPKNQIQEGRGGLEDWKTRGYLSIEGVDRPASKQMEYAANDFEIALMAKALHREADYKRYGQRSRNWEALWDEEATDAGFHGFIWPRHRDGSWRANFNALETGSWGGQTFYEGNSWTYSTFVPQDVARLIERCGGKEEFVRRLDAFFTGTDRYAVGNEPGFLSPYLYVWAGRPDRTQDQVRRILANSYHAGRDGLPGNDDSGAMSSWYAFGKMGFFPNAGQDVYLLGSPAFPEMTLRLPNGRTFVLEAKNVSAENRYIAHAEWNGRPYTRAWFRHEDLLRGGRLVLTMSATPTQWARDGTPPPSASDRSSR